MTDGRSIETENLLPNEITETHQVDFNAELRVFVAFASLVVLKFLLMLLMFFYFQAVIIGYGNLVKFLFAAVLELILVSFGFAGVCISYRPVQRIFVAIVCIHFIYCPNTQCLCSFV